MYLFTRRTRLSEGNGTAGVEWAGSVAAKVTELTGREIRLWGSAFSPGAGIITWTGWFEDLQTLELAGDKLAADPAMERLVKAGAKYTDGGLDDGLVQVIHGVPSTAPVEYVGGVVAVAAPGNTGRARAAGIEIAQRAEAITGVPVLFGRALTGPYFQMHWFTGYENVTAMEKADTTQASDPNWSELLDATKDLFIADTRSPRATIYRRLA
jgi:hypothetical protein